LFFQKGVTPGYPNLPPGYGGPFEPEEAGEDEEEEEAPPAVENEEQYGEYEGSQLKIRSKSLPESNLESC